MLCSYFQQWYVMSSDTLLSDDTFATGICLLQEIMNLLLYKIVQTWNDNFTLIESETINQLRI